jgi:RNA polymerase sigma-70 factor (ECF subfamily)
MSGGAASALACAYTANGRVGWGEPRDTRGGRLRPEGWRPPVEHVTDDELLARVRDGDESALGALYDRYHGLVMALGYRALGDRAAAEEVLQEVFLSVWRRAETFEPTRGSARVWVLSLARNRTIDRLRRKRAAPQERALEDREDFTDTRFPGVFEEAYASLQRDQVRRALSGLPDEQRQIVELAYFAGQTQQQIATGLGVPLGTVKSRTRLALDRLRGLLDRELAWTG